MEKSDDANLDGVFSATRSLLIVLGTALAAHGLGDTKLYNLIQLGAGSVMVIGPALWGVISAIQKWRAKRTLRTQAVNAGMNLAASGQMIIKSDGTPVPATDETAHEIVKVFSPPAPVKS